MTGVLVTGIGELVTNDTRLGDGSALGLLHDAALVVEHGHVAWVGSAVAAPDTDVRRDLGGRAVVPGFVDSHAHVTETGLALTGVVMCLVSPVTWVHHLVWLIPGLLLLVDNAFRAPGAPGGGGGYTSQYNTTGWPAGVVRAGTSKDDPGLPLGIQVVAQPWRDDVVIAAMAHIESQTGGWVPPALIG